MLLDQIQNTLPNDENIKYSTMADKLEWDKVKVGSHTSQECKEQWLIITTKVLMIVVSFILLCAGNLIVV
jgi:hypothetical protein